MSCVAYKKYLELDFKKAQTWWKSLSREGVRGKIGDKMWEEWAVLRTCNIMHWTLKKLKVKNLIYPIASTYKKTQCVVYDFFFFGDFPGCLDWSKKNGCNKVTFSTLT